MNLGTPSYMSILEQLHNSSHMILLIVLGFEHGTMLVCLFVCYGTPAEVWGLAPTIYGLGFPCLPLGPLLQLTELILKVFGGHALQTDN